RIANTFILFNVFIMNALAIHLYLTIRYINLTFNYFGNFYRIIVITKLMNKNGILILNKLAKYEYTFDINSYNHCIDICREKMNHIKNEI
ncbi:hypothetical protein EEL50_14100, partial [Muribaculaceae bacterium Isolate-105 (HZI)]